MKRNWANDPICKLCGIDPETPTHLLQRLHLLKASLVLFKTMAQSIRAKLGWNEWILTWLLAQMPSKV